MPSGTVTVTATETTIFETNVVNPAMLFGYVDLSNMASGDTFVFRTYVKIDGTNYRKADEVTLSGAQSTPVLKIVTSFVSSVCTFKLTGQRTAGVDRSFAYRWNARY